MRTKVGPRPGPGEEALTSPPGARAMLRAMVSPMPEPPERRGWPGPGRTARGPRRPARHRCPVTETSARGRELGGNSIAVEFPGRKHATLTEHRQQDGVDRVLRFFEEKLKVASDQQPDEASRSSP